MNRKNISIAEEISKTYSREAILKDFPILVEMGKLENKYRFNHTFVLLDSLYALIDPDVKAGHAKFTRTAQVALDRGEKSLSLKSFEKIRERVKPLVEQNLLFTTALCATHDYGTLDKDKVARHFVYSGFMCREDFEKLGFNSKDVELAVLIIGNHSYLGDFLLGEATEKYSDYLEEQFAKVSDKKKAFELLWLLTVLDINGAGGGFITEDKMIDLWKLSSFEQLRANFGTTAQEILQARVRFLNKKLDAAKVELSFNEAYMQYIYDIIKSETFNQPENAGVGEQLLSYLGQFSEATKQVDKTGKPNYVFVSFASGEKGTDVGEAIKDIIQRVNAANVSGKPFDLAAQTFLGYSYKIDPVTGYLLIQN